MYKLPSIQYIVTDRPTKPTYLPTKQRTDIRVHEEVILVIRNYATVVYISKKVYMYNIYLYHFVLLKKSIFATISYFDKLLQSAINNKEIEFSILY